MAMAVEWVAAFEGIAVALQRAIDHDAPVHALRIEWDYVSSTLEVV
jgi:hypothetical protein